MCGSVSVHVPSRQDSRTGDTFPQKTVCVSVCLSEARVRGAPGGSRQHARGGGQGVCLWGGAQGAPPGVTVVPAAHPQSCISVHCLPFPDAPNPPPDKTPSSQTRPASNPLVTPTKQGTHANTPADTALIC